MKVHVSPSESQVVSAYLTTPVRGSVNLAPLLDPIKLAPVTVTSVMPLVVAYVLEIDDTIGWKFSSTGTILLKSIPFPVTIIPTIWAGFSLLDVEERKVEGKAQETLVESM